jgi:hypothetical protein
MTKAPRPIRGGGVFFYAGGVEAVGGTALFGKERLWAVMAIIAR